MNIVTGIKAAGLDITEVGDIEDFLGFNIYKVDSDTYHLLHQKLINQIVSDMVLSNSDATPKTNQDLTKKYWVNVRMRKISTNTITIAVS